MIRPAHLAISLFLGVLVLGGCGRDGSEADRDAATAPEPAPQPAPEAPQPVPEPEPEPAAPEPEPAPPPQPDPDTPVAGPVTYECQNGFHFHVTYFPDRASVKLSNSRTVEAPQVRSADGAHYEAEGVSWWNKGNAGTLEQDAQPSLDCVEIARAR
ncbi:MliC family protein [Coralloluteibacterium stylophorae]|uniref:MliC family protein n=1 Tax=Coralloluteibacterium stylophorae TaxID=1776034 RepID=A0A8J7VUE5_9GAMM|nr:MliC family protein [Coralloluteibacterium stylophorae]MBS7456371.1 MliC family protein [Coralloluteibacterium stylophorae]